MLLQAKLITTYSQQGSAMDSKNPHWGSSLDDFLKEEGIFDEVCAEAISRAVAWQLSQEIASHAPGCGGPTNTPQ